jgi:hypothetical protein
MARGAMNMHRKQRVKTRIPTWRLMIERGRLRSFLHFIALDEPAAYKLTSCKYLFHPLRSLPMPHYYHPHLNIGSRYAFLHHLPFASMPLSSQHRYAPCFKDEKKSTGLMVFTRCYILKTRVGQVVTIMLIVGLIH